MPRLILLRHGQSLWNRDAIFTGWTDVDLTPLGIEQACAAGRLLKSTIILSISALRPYSSLDAHTLGIVGSDARSDLATRRAELAPQRTPLWRATGPETG